jgi:hypothetical protein
MSEIRTQDPEVASDSSNLAVDRRKFLGGLGGVSLGTLASGSALGALVAADAAEAIEVAPQNPNQRRNSAFQVRHQAALAEKNRGAISHPTNGDEEMYTSFIGNFHKSLPHNALGEVDQAAYQTLLDALDSGSFAAMETVPAGGTRTLLNPLGGLAFTLEGPDSPAVGVNPPPSIASAEAAAQAAELYWMALLRDVPFENYGFDPLVAQAAADLSNFSAFAAPKVAGQVTPETLFRLDYLGALDGPIVSQFLLRAFRYDGIPIDPKISTALPGVDFLTSFAEWLDSQNGVAAAGADPRDPVLRYPRNVRDLGRNAGQDSIYSAFFRAALIAGGFGAGSVDSANPYQSSGRQGGFATFGLAHLLGLVGLAHKAERHTWYQKWNVHRFLRPEAFGGLVHNKVTGAANYPIHPELLNSDVLPLIFEYNRQQNLARLGQNVGTYLLPQLFRAGSPTHPSFPAGHAISAGACVTVLKAWFNEAFVIPAPVKPSADGLSLLPYVVGVDGPPLTMGGELNKLCHNLSTGRDMSGVHWRADDVEGNCQGEEVAIRLLREERATYPEPFSGFTLTKFDGTTIVI